MRAVTADHIMFNECLSMFRPEKIKENGCQEELTGYLLLDFNLTESLKFEYFQIDPTIRVNFTGAYTSFIAPVRLPRWFENNHNAHLFCIGLAAVFSFISMRPVKSTRNGYIIRKGELSEDSIAELAIQFPVMTSGPGSHHTQISKEELEDLYKKLQEIIEVLYTVEYRQYINAMQSIRLVHLAHLNKRDDFGLAYYLLVSSIDSVSNLAIKRKRVRKRHPKEDVWVEHSESNHHFNELLKAYKDERGKNEYLTDRFITFINEFCPVDEWSKLKHPREYMFESWGGDNPYKHHNEFFVGKHPKVLSPKLINDILKNMYVDRSNFTHRGINPDHTETNGLGKYFERIEEYIYEEESPYVKVKTKLVPNYELVTLISKVSLTKYFKSKMS